MHIAKKIAMRSEHGGAVLTDLAHTISLRNLTKSYHHIKAINDVSFDVKAGEFVTLLGPSGSGKTTLLMALAGFVKPTSGSILLDEREITDLEPEARDFGVVFQGYALFPHMTVAENIAYPLRVRRIAKPERHARVQEALALVQLSHLAQRKPSQLSGGQQQRVALARALVFRPKLLLLDEPLSALDKSLRTDMQIELKRLHRQLGTTFINVTHDQEEAITMSDRIAIMRGGKLVQIGAPHDLFENPSCGFVAGFLGRSNFLPTILQGYDGKTAIATANSYSFQHILSPSHVTSVGDKIMFALRPNKIRLLASGENAVNEIEGKIITALYAGPTMQLLVKTGLDINLEVSMAIYGGGNLPSEGDFVRLGWDINAAVPVLDDM